MTKIYDVSASFCSSSPVQTGLCEGDGIFSSLELCFVCSRLFNVHGGILQMRQTSSRAPGSACSCNFPCEELRRMQKLTSYSAVGLKARLWHLHQTDGWGGDWLSSCLCSRGSLVQQQLLALQPLMACSSFIQSPVLAAWWMPPSFFVVPGISCLFLSYIL